jgi:hypothetical protein
LIDKIFLFLIKKGIITAAGSRRMAATILPLSPSGNINARRRTANTDAEDIRTILLSVIAVLLCAALVLII